VWSPASHREIRLNRSRPVLLEPPVYRYTFQSKASVCPITRSSVASHLRGSPVRGVQSPRCQPTPTAVPRAAINSTWSSDLRTIPFESAWSVARRCGESSSPWGSFSRGPVGISTTAGNRTTKLLLLRNRIRPKPSRRKRIPRPPMPKSRSPARAKSPRMPPHDQATTNTWRAAEQVRQHGRAGLPNRWRSLLLSIGARPTPRIPVTAAALGCHRLPPQLVCNRACDRMT